MIPFWLKRYYHAAFRFPEADQRRVVPCGSTAKGTDLRPPWMRPGPLYSRMAERRHQHFSESPDVWAKLMGPATLLQDSVNMFNSHHMIEHLLDRFLASHFRDMYECLISGGGIRVGGPGIGSACREFVEGGLDWFSSMKPISRPSWGAIPRISSFVAASI